MQRVILTIENDDEYRENNAELLEDEGYVVIQAATLKEARQRLKDRFINMIMCDIRMENDEDAHDHSGLEFLKEHAPWIVPCIVHTNYRNIENMEKAYDFADKVTAKGDEEKLLIALDEAWEKHYGHMQPCTYEEEREEASTFRRIAELLGTDKKRQEEDAVELAFLFRCLFHDVPRVRVGRILWHREKRLAVCAHLFKTGRKSKSYVVICGEARNITKEKENFNQYKPSLTGANTAKGSYDYAHLRIGTLTYETSDGDLDLLINLEDLYHQVSEKHFLDVLQELIDGTLSGWGKSGKRKEEPALLHPWFDQRLTLAFDESFEEKLARNTAELGKALTELDAPFTFSENQFSYKVDQDWIHYPYPVQLFSTSKNLDIKIRFENTPGLLSGKNILTNGHIGSTESKRQVNTWITDFQDCDLSPIIRNYLALEAMIRYDWLKFKDSKELVALEKALAGSSIIPKNKLPDDASPQIAKAYRTIIALRRMMVEQLEDDIAKAYQLGIAYYAARKILQLDTSNEMTMVEARKAGHHLISCGMILKSLLPKTGTDKAPPKRTIQQMDGSIQIKINESSRILMVNDAPTRLSKNCFEAFMFLYEREGELCKGQEVGDAIWPHDYDNHIKDSRAKLTQTIRRLEKELEKLEQPPTIHRVGKDFKLDWG